MRNVKIEFNDNGSVDVVHTLDGEILLNEVSPIEALTYLNSSKFIYIEDPEPAEWYATAKVQP
jgi:hypothetical protein